MDKTPMPSVAFPMTAIVQEPSLWLMPIINALMSVADRIVGNFQKTDNPLPVIRTDRREDVAPHVAINLVPAAFVMGAFKH